MPLSFQTRDIGGIFDLDIPVLGEITALIERGVRERRALVVSAAPRLASFALR
jgi:hypothetical protein